MGTYSDYTSRILDRINRELERLHIETQNINTDTTETFVAIVVSVMLLFAPLIMESLHSIDTIETGMFLDSLLIAYVTLSLIVLFMLLIASEQLVMIRAAVHVSKFFILQAFLVSILYGLALPLPGSAIGDKYPEGVPYFLVVILFFILVLAILYWVTVELSRMIEFEGMFLPVFDKTTIVTAILVFILAIIWGDDIEEWINQKILNPFMDMLANFLSVASKESQTSPQNVLIAITLILLIIFAWLLRRNPNSRTRLKFFSVSFGTAIAIVLRTFILALFSAYPSTFESFPRWLRYPYALMIFLFFMTVYIVLLRHYNYLEVKKELYASIQELLQLKQKIIRGYILSPDMEGILTKIESLTVQESQNTVLSRLGLMEVGTRDEEKLK